MATNRIFYACQAVGFGATGGSAITGVQSVGCNSTFGLEQVFQLGQIEIYENIEGTPEVELTIEKVFDSADNLYGLFAGANQSITQVATKRNTVTLAIVADTESVHQGTAGTIGVECTGVYMSNYSANFSVDGTSTDTITVVGNHQNWGAKTMTIAKNEAADVAKRQDLTLAVGGVAGPVGLTTKVQSATVSIDFGREDLLEFGKKTPYFRAASFPVECSAEVTFNAVAANLTSNLNFVDPQTSDVQSADSSVSISYSAGGTGTGSVGISGRCTGMNYSGGDASGGNATVSYSYTGYNNFTY